MDGIRHEPTLAQIEAQIAALAKKIKARRHSGAAASPAVLALQQQERRLKTAKARLQDEKTGRPKALLATLALFGFHVKTRRSERALDEPSCCFEAELRLSVAAPQSHLSTTQGLSATPSPTSPTASSPTSPTSPTAPTPSDIANAESLIASLAAKIRSDKVFTEHRLDDEFYADADGDAEYQKELDAELVRHAACAGSPFYWSFCRNKLEDSDQVWHCVVCCECREVGWIHCEKCDVCVEGECETCRELEEESTPAPQHHHHHGPAKRKSLK
ncbi:hypothetical protein HDU98_009354 [Podochytrium sp. JEL0797]|nr:hypothetical protein HDU98_009354 [Podochytrium sp. JEL0797]